MLATERVQPCAKLLPEGAVDDKVEAGVDLHQQVTDVEVVEVRPATRVGHAEGQQLVAKSRSLADDEDEYDDHHHQREVVFLAVGASREAALEKALADRV